MTVHLIVDGHADNVGLMTDKGLMKDWLVKTVELAGMRPFGEPFIYGFPWPGSQDWTALTGFQPLWESHCSIHCWPERRFVYVDLFSCGDFKWGLLADHVKGSFQMRYAKIVLLSRGIDAKTGDLLEASVRIEGREANGAR